MADNPTGARYIVRTTTHGTMASNKVEFNGSWAVIHHPVKLVDGVEHKMPDVWALSLHGEYVRSITLERL